MNAQRIRPYIAVSLVVGLLALGQARGEQSDPVIKAGENLTLTGKLRGGLMAIGGETTGWKLTYNTSKGAVSIEVDMGAIKDAKPDGNAEVTITGQVVAKEYVERGTTLILKAVSVVDVARPEKDSKPAPSRR